jgi:hypothetical protein
LEYAVWGRGLDGGSGQPRLIHQRDRGSQDSAIRFTSALPTPASSP